MNDDWESEIGALLDELTASQGELLELLAEKRRLLLEGDHVRLDALQPREQQLTERLKACQQRRQQLLSRAEKDGMPSDSIHALASGLPAQQSGRLRTAVNNARGQARLLRHESLTNWVLIQRTLLHLSQMIEIIATGGRMKPTYGDEASGTGALVDRAV